MKDPLSSKHVKIWATIIASLFVLFLSVLSLSDYCNQNQLHIGEGSPVLASLLGPDMSTRVCYLAQLSLSSALKVSLYLPLLSEHPQSFSQTGTWPRNPQSVREKLRVLCQHILCSVVTKICLYFCNIFCYVQNKCNSHLNYRGVYPGQAALFLGSELLIWAFIAFQLDYWNGLYAGMTVSLLKVTHSATSPQVSDLEK